ncbi:oxidoreductase [Cladophialophora psammophila CBS 110553]|uniref:Oxidoreductase n=1 Tax=Cladophialophora psammophila CBS 110553 TaxID=1182543 RepID=W9X2E2_9EURO|nr:oxidoreductase [Cladophialophora psammophila CBS 110553]EXJ74647.1 oxidoreductase [Cladophialophora psammophila CBS 110553]
MLTTEFTKLLNIQHPVVLAGMGQTAGGKLAAAVSNAGGLGVIGGVNYTPQMLRDKIQELKDHLRDPSLPFGIDLLLPQVGGSARKTNKDYTKGSLDTLVEIMIESGVRLFVSAVGIPPKRVVDRLHEAGILYMNMVGHPKHVHKACAIGADIICAQGGEAGGHTGDIPFSVLVPACVDVCKTYTSPITGKSPLLIAGGGVADGRGLAAALMLGASAVWVGTRFVTAEESEAPEQAKESIIQAGFDDTVRTTIFTGRPLRTHATPYIRQFEHERQDEIRDLTSKGIIPVEHDLDRLEAAGKLTAEIEDEAVLR